MRISSKYWIYKSQIIIPSRSAFVLRQPYPRVRIIVISFVLHQSRDAGVFSPKKFLPPNGLHSVLRLQAPMREDFDFGDTHRHCRRMRQSLAAHFRGRWLSGMH